jgi:site-specific DNA recombinase
MDFAKLVEIFDRNNVTFVSVIDRALWDRVHGILRESARKCTVHIRAQTPVLLKSQIFGPTGRAMTPVHARANGRLYRYYVSTDVLKRDATACTVPGFIVRSVDGRCFSALDTIRSIRGLRLNTLLDQI